MAKGIDGFRYRRRTEEDIDRRASQRGGDFERITKEEYPTFTPKQGNNGVRFLPNTWEENPKHYGLDISIHRNVGPNKADVLCLNKHAGGGRCPVCEAKARAEANDDDELADQFKATKRVLAWVLDVDNMRAGPMVWAQPWTVDRDIAKASKDRRTGELYAVDDPYEGYDVYFERIGQGRNTEYVAYQLAKNPSAVPERALEYVINNPLPETLIIRDYDTVKRLLTGGIDDAEMPVRARRTPARQEEDEAPARRRDDERPARPRPREEEPPARARPRDEEDERPARPRPRDEDDYDRPARPRNASRDDDYESRPARRPPDEDAPARRSAYEDEEAPPRGRWEDDPPARPVMRDDDEAPPRRSSNGARDDMAAPARRRIDDEPARRPPPDDGYTRAGSDEKVAIARLRERNRQQ